MHFINKSSKTRFSKHYISCHFSTPVAGRGNVACYYGVAFALRYSCFFLFFVYIESICESLRDLVSFVQYKKRKKYHWRSVTFGTRNNTPPLVFFTFFKLYRLYEITQYITY